MLLPQKLGPLTLMRKLGSDGVAESFLAALDDSPGRPVVARRLLPHIVREPARLAGVEARVEDLTAVRHPILVQVQRIETVGDDRLILEDHVDAVALDEVVAWCRREGKQLPHNIFLNLATQICNGLEALHGRPGKATGDESVLHLALSPASVLVTAEGRVLVGEYGWVRSPTTLPSGGAADAASSRFAHLSPEQTQPDQKLSPASDIFSLGSLLYELLTLEALFQRESSLQTIHAVRKAEVSGALQHVKRMLPGLDKVLYRALSLNPRHRYQRAFVLREDIRGLMAGFSFTKIQEETQNFLEPLLRSRRAGGEGVFPSAPVPAAPAEDPQDSTAVLLARTLEPAADSTQAFLRQQTRPPEPAPPFREVDLLEEDDDPMADVPTTLEDMPAPDAGDPTDPARMAGPPGERLAEPEASAAGIRSPAATISTFIDEDPPATTRVPLDQTTWVRRDIPPADAFDHDESTDVSMAPGSAPVPSRGTPAPASSRSMPPVPPRATPVPAPVAGSSATPAPSKRQLSPDEAAALGLRRTPSPAPRHEDHGRVSPAVTRETPAPPPMSASAPPAPERMSLADRAPRPGTPKPAPAATPPASTIPAGRAGSETPKPAGTPAPAKSKAKPEARPAPPPVDDDLDDYKPRSSRLPLVLGGMAAVFLLVVFCGGGAILAASQVAPMLAGRTDGPSLAQGGAPNTGMPVTGPTPGTPVVSPPTPIPTIASNPTPIPDAPPTPPVTPPVTPPPAEIAAADPVLPPAAPTASKPPASPAVTPSTPRTSTPRTSTPTPVASTPPVRTTPPTRVEPSEPRVAVNRPTPTRTPSSPSTETARTASMVPSTPTNPATPSTTTTSALEVRSFTPGSMDELSEKARNGRLSAADRLQLEMTDRSDPAWTRAQTLLYEDAKGRADGKAQRKHLDAILGTAENKYNAVYLAEGAHLDIADKKFERALDRANTAERFWGRIPPDLVFSRKAMIYEAQAAAHQGRFYQSGGQDLASLGNAIEAWEKYQRHVATKSRTDLSRIADEQLAKLYDARRRLE